MPIKTIKSKDLTWYNIDDPNKEVVDFLRDNFTFHPLDFKDVLGEAQHPKLDTYKDYLFIVLHFPGLNKQSNQISDNEIDIFIGPDYLITIQKKRYKVIKDTFFRLLGNQKLKKEYMSQGPGFLLYKILDILYHQSNTALSHINRNIRQTEKNIFDQDKNAVRELADLRRQILQFRAILDPQRVIINHLTHLNRGYLSKDMNIYFDDIADYLNKAWMISGNYKEIIDGLHETNESLISDRTNQVIKVLTVISVGMLPLTLLSGIYGMNIEGLPWAHNPGSVWGIFLGLLGVIFLTILYFKKKKWL